MSYSISIDPGVTGQGMAVWDNDYWLDCVPPVAVANLHPKGSKTDTWEQRKLKQFVNFVNIIQEFEPTHIFCEGQAFHESTAKGYTAMQRGDIIKLTHFCGMMEGCAILRGIQWKEVTVIEWRGQMPDSAVEARVIDRLGRDICSNLGLKTHLWDACAIGLHVKGCWKQAR